VRSFARRSAIGSLADGHLGAAAWRRTDPPFRSRRSICLGGVCKLIQSAGFRASMSRKGDCYDNAPMESLFHTLKTELVHHCRYATRAEATRDIFAYIEGFYNRTRRHSAIGYISPIEMELKQLNPVHFFGGRSA
jgi:transposase InsO family protein